MSMTKPSADRAELHHDGRGSEPLQLSIAAYQRDLTSQRGPATSHVPSLRAPGRLRNRSGQSENAKKQARWRVFAAPGGRSIDQDTSPGERSGPCQ